jgi:hypothetical protein
MDAFSIWGLRVKVGKLITDECIYKEELNSKDRMEKA